MAVRPLGCGPCGMPADILSDNLLEMGDSDRTELLLKIYDYSISLVNKLRELETSMSRMIVN